MKTLAATLPILLALAAPLGAQGVITDGTASFEWSGNTVGSANISAFAGADDHLATFWWWYRLETDVMENAFPFPPAGSYTGDTHNVTYDLPVFSADIETTISSAPIPGFTALLTSSLTVTNTLDAPITLSLFNGADVNLADSANNDYADFVPGPKMFIYDDADNYCEYAGVDADDYLVAAFPDGVINTLNDMEPDNFNSTGLPFVEANFTGGYQRTFTLEPGDSATMCVTLSVSTDAPVDCDGGPPPPPNIPFVRADFDADGAFNALVDSLALLGFAFQGGPPPICQEAADADNDGVVNGLVDVLYMLSHGFQGGPPPAAPYPACGPDPDIAGSIGCAANACP